MWLLWQRAGSVPGRRGKQHPGGVRASRHSPQGLACFRREGCSGHGFGAARDSGRRRLCAGRTARGPGEDAGREDLRYGVSFSRSRNQPENGSRGMGVNGQEHGGSGRPGDGCRHENDRRVSGEGARALRRSRKALPASARRPGTAIRWAAPRRRSASRRQGPRRTNGLRQRHAGWQNHDLPVRSGSRALAADPGLIPQA